MQNKRERVKKAVTRPRWIVPALVALVAIVVSQAAPAGSAASREVAKKAVMGQVDDDGERSPIDGSRSILTRTDDWLRIDMLMPTPEPGSYHYPDAATAPSDHPEIMAGDPEVFTAWMFLFQYPDLCSIPCSFDDMGDTPAQGGAYLVDSVIADGPWIHLDGIVVDGQEPFDFTPMADAATTEVHVAVAPHGMANDDPTQLLQQLNTPVGAPEQWFFGGTFLPGDMSSPMSGAPNSGS